ncbi:UL16-binding protein 1-like [Tenrec ecaudatus]|uniref:UL16-binding protein 1-like n=1 Tax=Tenrec ecaudatus TaxID=94439 RepID=UPI003F591472
MILDRHALPLALCLHLLALCLHLLHASDVSREDTHSLRYNFTINFKTPLGQQGCLVQGQEDGRTFLQYKCGSNKVIAVGLRGMQINATEEWKEQIDTLKDIADELRALPSYINLENYKTKDPLSLQASMSCERKASRSTGACWLLDFGRPLLFHLDAENNKWTEADPEANRLIKEELENNTLVTNLLRRTSKGDCNQWLQTFRKHWEKMPAEPAPTIETTEKSKNTARIPKPWTFIMTFAFTCSTLLIAYGGVL